jgi:hypothetical protein
VMWLVMLESAKDRILGVDPPGQQVPPCVRYGTACLLIRYAIGWVSCSVEWGWLLSVRLVFVTFFVNCLNHMVQKGPLPLVTRFECVQRMCGRAWVRLVDSVQVCAG